MICIEACEMSVEKQDGIMTKLTEMPFQKPIYMPIYILHGRPGNLSSKVTDPLYLANIPFTDFKPHIYKRYKLFRSGYTGLSATKKKD